MNYFFRIDEKGIIDDLLTFRGFTDTHSLFNKIQCLQMLKSRDFYAKLPSSWKKTTDSGIIITKSVIYCTECKEHSICDNCDQRNNQIKELAVFLNELKQQLAKSVGHTMVCQ